MANPEHVAKLKQGVYAWNKWQQREREQSPTIQVDLSGANLQGIDLRPVPLAGLKGLPLRVVDLRGVDLSNASLRGAHLDGADLSGAHLRDADLVRAHLDLAKLQDVDLRWSDCSKASLREADLSKADLSGADLNWADLERARLYSANLRGTDLRGANLREADLNGALFLGTYVEDAYFGFAEINLTIFANVDLSSAKGLEDIRHRGRSTVGIDTLFASNGRIPEVFLRGAGAPEDFITYLPALTQNPIEFYSCFISYSHEDKQFARRLHDTLQGRGIRCWLDEKQMLPGDDIYRVVEHGIRVWDKVLLCCSKHSLTSWWVDNEITTALAKEQQLSKQSRKNFDVIIPLNLDGYLLSDNWDGDGKASLIKRRLAADFIGWEHDNAKFEQQFEAVMRALRADTRVREPKPKPKLGMG